VLNHSDDGGTIARNPALKKRSQNVILKRQTHRSLAAIGFGFDHSYRGTSALSTPVYAYSAFAAFAVAPRIFCWAELTSLLVIVVLRFGEDRCCKATE
jgi:hypothetical protein